MIGTIRKHSKWLWVLIAALTIISFVLFMGSGPARRANTGRGGADDYGTIYGHKVTAEEYESTQRAFFIYYWLHNGGEWPDRAPGITAKELQQQTYLRLMLTLKAKALGIYVGEDAMVSAASEFLRMPTLTRLFGGSSGQAVPADGFVARVLEPERLTADDFQNFIRSDLAIQQLIQTFGLPGALVTPNEASLLYVRENQEISVQAVFFSLSNYLAQAVVAPAAVGQFYTNNMAVYREPDRVQVNYVAYNVTNYFAQATAEWAKTNFDETVDAAYRRYGATEFADAKTPEEAKARIREVLIRQRALAAAAAQAREFATTLFAMDPVKPENLGTVAKQKGLAVQTTAPFAQSVGPQEINASPDFTQAAFQLNADSPYAGPIVLPDAVYVIALANQLPSEIPSLDAIHARVTEDFRELEALALARNAGTNFYITASIQMAAGKTFPAAAIAVGQRPELLAPFSLNSADVPELGNRASLGQLKQAAFTTPVGHASAFVPTDDGGFVLFVQFLLPVDTTKQAAEFPRFLAQARAGRQNEAFNLWLEAEANRELRDTPLARSASAAAAAP